MNKLVCLSFLLASVSTAVLGEGHPWTHLDFQNDPEDFRMTAKVRAPFFYVVGNHDITRSRPAYTNNHEESSMVWKEFYGSQAGRDLPGRIPESAEYEGREA